jgi:hypothetical protein
MRVQKLSIDELVDQMLGPCPERGTLLEPFVIEMLNRFPVVEPPRRAVAAFAGIKEAYIETSWNGVVKFPGIGWLIKLAPIAQQREIERYGDAVLLFTNFFNSVRKIVKYFKATDDQLAVFIKFVTFQSRFEGLLSMFLFVERLQHHHKGIMKHIDRHDNWALFRMEMWEMVRSHNVLLKEINNELKKK